jgi:AraC family transcriptional regulator
MAASSSLGCGCPGDGYTIRKAGGYVVSRSAYISGCGLGTHAHAEDRIVLTAWGRFGSQYGPRAFELDPSRSIYRPAHVEHRDWYPNDAACITIRLPAYEGTKSAAFDFADADLPSATRRLWSELDARDSASELAIESLSGEIAGRLAPIHRAESRAGWIRRVRDRIEYDYADPPTLRAMANEVGREVSHVATTFRKTYGKSIGEFVRDVRIWRTRTLLDDASIPLCDVASRGGFADQSHFTRLFKRRFSMTPGEYRRRGDRLAG